jgi:hypothetical protein
MDILNYVLAQATDWSAGFVVRVWWRYLRLRFADTVNWWEKFWLGHKEEKAISLHSAHCRPTIGQNIQIFRFVPTGLFCHMYRRFLWMPLTAWLCLCISGVYFDNVDDYDVDNNESDDNVNILCIFLCHMTHTNSNLHVTQFVTFLLHVFCDLSDWSNCTSTIMYVTTVDANWKRENKTACSIRTYGLLKCR